MAAPDGRTGTAHPFLLRQVAPTKAWDSPVSAGGANRSRPRGGWSRMVAWMVTIGAPRLGVRRVYVVAIALGVCPFVFGLIRALSVFGSNGISGVTPPEQPYQ